AAIHVDDTLLWIDRSATPFATAIESGKHNGSVVARRREERVVPQSLKPLQRSCMSARRELGEICFGDRLPRERCRRDGKRLRGPRLLTFEIGCRYGPLLDAEERSTRLPVEDVHEATLRNLG